MVTVRNMQERKQQDCRLRVFESRVLRRIFGPKKDEVIGDWRRPHKEERNDLYCSPNIIGANQSRRIRWVGV